MTSNETTITTNFKVSGLKSLIEAKEAYIQLKQAASGNISGGFAGSMNKDIEKAQAGVRKLSEMIKSAGQSGSTTNQFSKMHNDINSSAEAAEKLGSKMRQAGSYGGSFAEAQGKAASASSKAAEAAQKASNAQRNANSAMSSTAASAGRVASASSKAESSWSKIKGSVKDAFAMFSVGMLGMTAINSAVEGVKSAFKGGYDTIKEQQSGQAMWSTSIQDAHPNLAKAQLRSQSAAANAAMTSTAIKAGNDYTQANSMAKQVYSSDAGEYSGNLAKTRSLVTGMFNIQDANALNDMEMQRFTTAVGNIGDTGKMSGAIAKSLNFLDGKMTRRMRDEYKLETGKTLSKTKQGNWDYSQISAQMAYRALDKYGNSGGVGEASKNINSTLGGVTRAGKSAINLGMARFETSFANQINKAFGGKSGLIGKLSAVFTNSDLINKIADKAAGKLSKLAVDIGKFGKGVVGVAQDIAPYAKQFGGGFAKGFTSEMKAIADGVKSAYNDVKGITAGWKDKLSNILPKGALKDMGEVAGKVTAVLVAFKGFTKIPGMSKLTGAFFKPALDVLGKIPGIGKLVSPLTKLLGITAKTDTTASGKMMTASETMMAAADKMNGGTGTSPEDAGSGASGASSAAGYAASRGVEEGAVKAEPGMTRAGYRAAVDAEALATKRGGSWGAKLVAKGEEILGPSETRMAKNASWLTKLKGGALTKLGGAGLKMFDVGQKLGGSKLFSGVSKLVGAGSKAGKFLGKGMPGINALFAGIDAFSAISSTKAGTNARHAGVGSAVGGGVGATVGGALGSLLGPLGTIGGGIAGQWAGNKLGGFVGGKWNKITTGASNLWDNAKQFGSDIWNSDKRKNFSKTGYSLGAAVSKIPMMGLAGKGIQLLSNPMKTIKTTISQVKDGFKELSHLKLSDIGDGLKKLNPFKGFKLSDLTDKLKNGDWSDVGKGLKKLNPFKGFKLSDITDKFKGIKNPFKGFKFPDVGKMLKGIKITNPFKGMKLSNPFKGMKISNPFKGLKFPKINWPKLPKFKNPLKGFKFPKLKNPFSGIKVPKFKWPKVPNLLKNLKMPKLQLPKFSNPLKNFKLPKITNPFKGIRLPKLKWPKLSNPFKGFKMPQIKWPKVPKFKNPFKKFKLPKITMPKWMQSISGWFKGADKADKSTKKATKSTSTAAKSVSRVGKSGKSGFSSLGKTASKAFSGIVKGAKSLGKKTTAGFKSLGKIGSSAFKGLTKSVKSGLKTAQSASKSGAKKIVSNLKAGLKGASKAGKSQFKALTKSVKSGLKSSQTAAKSGSKKIGSNVKTGLKTVGKAGKSQFKSLTRDIKSGLRTAQSAAKSGSKKIANNVKSGLRNVGKLGKTEFRSLSNSVKSGLRSAASAAKSGSRKIGTSVKAGLSNVKTAGRSAFKGLTSTVKSGLNQAKSAARSGGKAVSNAVKSGLSSMASNARGQFNKLSSAAKSGMAKVTSSVKTGIAKANSAMSSGFSKMVSTASRATSRISSSMSKIGTSASSAASKVRTLQSAINGLKSKTVTITANVKGKGAGKLATGTPGARASFARLAKGTPGFHLARGWAKNGGVKTGTYMVNDSKSSHWQEAFQTADGLIGIFPPVRDLLVHLREGDQVLNGDDTHKMYPRLKAGTPAAKQAMMRQAPAPAKAPVINVTVNLNGGQYNEKTIPAKIADAIANIVGEKFKQLFPEAPI